MGGLVFADSNKDCKDYQRRWRNYCVDKNLDDKWLEALNRLNSLNMVSICEGHCEQNPHRSNPNINLHLKCDYVPIFINQFDDFAHKLHTKLIELFANKHTKAEADIRIHLNVSRVRQEIRRDFILHIECIRGRNVEEMDDFTITWFTSVIDDIREIDFFLTGILQFE